jgi:NTP pyrophosphatase (non-canonical NTP hydrolase)
MSWLIEYAGAAEKTDRFVGRPDHLRLLAAGLVGEIGSVLAELKKEQRERDAYPAYRRRMLEEAGDVLWYLMRIVSVIDRKMLREFEAPTAGKTKRPDGPSLPLFLDLGASVGDVLVAISKDGADVRPREMLPRLKRVWSIFLTAIRNARVDLREAADGNIRKIESRWPRRRVYSDLFDDDVPEEDKLPRHLEVEFRERGKGEQRVVLLRCNGLNFGDRLTDNIEDPDGYRYHDVFHFAHAVHLGWSPVVRALLRCKRKFSSKKDEGQDGARAVILEEAVSAIVFSRAKQLNFFDGIDHVDYDLLKIVREFILGFEVETIPQWQWEAAILDGYATFRKLRANRGGTVTLDLLRRELTYVAPT